MVAAHPHRRLHRILRNHGCAGPNVSCAAGAFLSGSNGSPLARRNLAEKASQRHFPSTSNPAVPPAIACTRRRHMHLDEKELADAQDLID
jgi:hypothetical protein